MTGTLWLVATPIGNLGDLSPRAVEVLGSVKLVCCEDTRRTGKLLHHAGLTAPRMAITNEHTEYHRIHDVLAVLGDGDDVALVSDAGTPGISDPGERIVAAAVEAGYVVSTVPGPVAAISALVVSGLPAGRFVFEGFLPKSGRERVARIAAIAAENRTSVLYESPHRVERTLADLSEACGGDRRVVVCRELTKLFEEVHRGTLGTVDLGSPKGEYVIVLDGMPADVGSVDDDAIRTALRLELATGATTRDAAAAVAKQLGVAKRQVYALALAERS